jgi:hypothetical protein
MRCPVPADIPWIVAARSDREMSRYIPGIPYPYSQSDARTFLEDTDSGWAEGSGAAFVVSHAVGHAEAVRVSCERYPSPLGPVAETLGPCASNSKRYMTRCPAPLLPASLALGTTGPPRSSCISREQLRITRVSPCVAHGLRTRASSIFASCCWRRSLAVDGSSGHLGGTRLQCVGQAG